MNTQRCKVETEEEETQEGEDEDDNETEKERTEPFDRRSRPGRGNRMPVIYGEYL